MNELLYHLTLETNTENWIFKKINYDVYHIVWLFALNEPNVDSRWQTCTMIAS